jgi:hypothetical protein
MWLSQLKAFSEKTYICPEALKLFLFMADVPEGIPE